MKTDTIEQALSQLLKKFSELAAFLECRCERPLELEDVVKADQLIEEAKGVSHREREWACCLVLDSFPCKDEAFFFLFCKFQKKDQRTQGKEYQHQIPNYCQHLDRQLHERILVFAARNKGGKVWVKDLGPIFAAVVDGRTITHVERETLEFLKHKFTTHAWEVLQEMLERWQRSRDKEEGHSARKPGTSRGSDLIQLSEFLGDAAGRELSVRSIKQAARRLQERVDLSSAEKYRLFMKIPRYYSFFKDNFAHTCFLGEAARFRKEARR